MASHPQHRAPLVLTLLIFCTGSLGYLYGADPYAAGLRKSLLPTPHILQGPIVEDDWYVHRIGNLWQRVTNFSYMGDDAYQDPLPSCDYPGGSGNSYLYRASLWLTAVIDGVPHTSKGEDAEWSPIDSVHVITGDDAKSEEDTYTSYYDVDAPLASDPFPLGVEVTERTYAWSSSFADDFIIYEYVIKNVGIDTDSDGYPDTPRDLPQFYFTLRLDADVSKLATWDVEYRFSNQDDHVMANGIPWDWIELFPNMAGRDHGLTAEDLDSTMMFMFDGDNPNHPADNNQDNDFGNPGVDSTLQSPGFIGFKILKTEPYIPPSSFHVNHIYNDPATDQEFYDRMIGQTVFEDFSPVANPTTGEPLPHDYRGVLTFGPLDTLRAGDSLKVISALGVGSDPDSGGVYSLLKLIEIMDIAQMMVDYDFEISTEDLAPAAPVVEIEEWIRAGLVEGIAIKWDDTPASHENFAGFKVWKSSGKTASGAYDWQPLATFADTAGSTNWPPPAADEAGKYQVIDSTEIINGMEYYYSVQSYSVELIDPFGVIESNILGENSFHTISPANPEAAALNNVQVVPNPYIGSELWNNPFPSDTFPWEHRLQFTNLPADAIVKIFTVDGDFVAEITAGETVRSGEQTTSVPPASVAEWDLITRNNQEAAPGLYLYVVESPSLGNTIGKFVIIR
ncbi:hypothetical protein ACFL5M_02190 [Candidatus Neomarinimicrobiota bacterium]